ncbi:MAG: hypothetical protein QGG40_09910 [Myxococcota bacterium]|nr:hypothetical protein [Myxococcota bacterium]
MAQEVSRPEDPLTSALAAAESLLREDRPAGAAEQLVSVLGVLQQRDLSEDSGVVTRARAALVGALVDLGRLDEASVLVEQALGVAAPPGERILLLDVGITLRVVRGEVRRASLLVDELGQSSVPAAQLAFRFRRAVLDRLSGQSEQAQRGYLWVLQRLEGVPGAEGLRASVREGLAELALSGGRGEVALEVFGAAAREWSRAGRGSSVARVLAGTVRARLVIGACPPPALLDAPLGIAEEGSLALLRVEILVARGLSRHRVGVSGALGDLDQAVEEAHRLGARLLEGRALLARGSIRRTVDDEERIGLCPRLPVSGPEVVDSRTMGRES